MWNVFQNDLTQATVEADISMYADDHQIFSSDHSIGRVEEKLLHDGSKITKWYEENLLQVNIKKYQSMVLGERNGTVEMNIQIGRVKIEQSHSIKLLGVNIDSDLNFSTESHQRSVYKVKSANWGTHATKEPDTYPCQIATIQGRYFTPFNVLQYRLAFLQSFRQA